MCKLALAADDPPPAVSHTPPWGRDVTTIAGSTLLTGIIGWPVTHSLSPAMHNAAFAALGLDMAYVPLPVAPQGVEAAVRGLRALGFRGANVTMPHKAAVLPSLDHVAADALLVQAVNTIVVDDDALHGYNTDIDGFVAALRDVVAEPLNGASGLVLGAGGAARAAVAGLLRVGVRRLVIVNRSVAAAEELVRLLQALDDQARFAVVALDELVAADVRGADILVNATPLGMVAPLKVPGVLVDNIRRDHIVYDVVYGQRPTMPLERARETGARAIDGLSMLAWQAALSFELWTGRAAPLEVMRSAARR
jgi:shikimate dehydrogenase